jgi:hypothetical protein
VLGVGVRVEPTRTLLMPAAVFKGENNGAFRAEK